MRLAQVHYAKHPNKLQTYQCRPQKKPRHKGGAKVSVIIAVPHIEGAVTLAVFEFWGGSGLHFCPDLLAQDVDRN
jgi:hypothetical protein